MGISPRTVLHDGGGGGISPYEPRPSYQNVIKKIVGSQRGFPDVASDSAAPPSTFRAGAR